MKFSQQVITAIIRSALTTVAGWLVGRGYITGSDVPGLIDEWLPWVIAGGMLVWSLIEKNLQQKKVDQLKSLAAVRAWR